MPRIFQPIPLKTGARIALNEGASHHLARVLRAEVGDAVTLFNGEGGEFDAVITQITKKNVEVEILQFVPRDAESPLDICLAQGIAKGEKMDFIVQKAVELGVKKIVPLLTERCNVRLDETREKKRVMHWQSVIVSACEQSGRNRVPEIVPPVAYADWISNEIAGFKFVLSPHTSNRFTDADISLDASITVLIGPEGGLSESEIKLALDYGFTALNLGPRVLRTETATLAALTFFQTLYGDMKVANNLPDRQ